MRLVKLVGLAIALCVAVPALTRSGVIGRQNPLDAKARRDEAFTVATGDPAMQAAYAKGRATLGRFLAVAENRPSGTRAFAVKIPVRDAGKVEYVWINRFSRNGERFSGAIDNTPRFVGNVRSGQIVAFARTDIVDWMYLQDERMIGNFTACALIAKEPAEARAAFMRQYGMTCGA